ncbi:hypothetical protein QAD02_022205 [Eretmocerus hayati]|uniref:Uncharacterized protein n=1 Tax=Eretmocerus hayati TaxID=131215 RepID=A0ACC2PUG4_9HYME|nr:hypothetical protein QAD02_022205 [Eretmocerus hayati]
MLTCLRAVLLGFVLLLGVSKLNLISPIHTDKHLRLRDKGPPVKTFSGITVAIFSGFFLYQLHEFSLLTPPSVDGPPLSLFGLGILTVALAWFIWHFDYSIRSQVISLAALIVIVGLMEAGVCIWALVRNQQFRHMPDRVVQDAQLAIFDQKFADVWKNMHTKMICCGVYGVEKDFTIIHQPRPWSCCYHVPKEDKNRCEEGCLLPMTQRTQSIFLYTFLLALGSVILKAITVSLAWCYAKMVKEGMVKNKRAMAMQNTLANKLASEAAEAVASRSSKMSDYSANISLVEKSRLRI